MVEEIMEGNALVSVIIPVFNLEEYVERSVKSVLSQTYNNIQIIIVDDGSTDSTQCICEKLADDDRIIYIRHEGNKGQTVTRNDGLNAASGDWIMFLDGDDTLEPSTIDSFMKAVNDDKDIDIVFAGYKVISDDNSIERLANIVPGVYTKREFTNYLFDEITSDVLTCIGSKIYRNDLVKTRKEWTSDRISTNYDMAFVIDALLACKKVAYIQEPVYDYIQRNNSITYSYREKMYSRICEARKKIPVLIMDCDCYNEKNKLFQKDQLRLVLSALNQEVAFKKGYSQFKKSVDEIRQSDQFKQVYQVFCSNRNDKARYLYVKLVKKKWFFVLFLIHKMLLSRRSGY